MPRRNSAQRDAMQEAEPTQDFLPKTQLHNHCNNYARLLV
jgi:hypothetical protein